MNDYLRPDSFSQWFHNDTLITPDSNNRYEVSTGPGFGSSQIGGEALSSGRFFTLVISRPDIDDAGTYTCSVNGTSQFGTVDLTVGEYRNS